MAVVSPLQSFLSLLIAPRNEPQLQVRGAESTQKRCGLEENLSFRAQCGPADTCGEPEGSAHPHLEF